MKYPPNFCDNLQMLKGGYNQCYKLAELMLPKLLLLHRSVQIKADLVVLLTP